MTHKLQLKNLALSLVLALTLVAGALPGVMQTGHAASAEETWGDNQTIESTKTINGFVDVEDDIILTINEDVTLTINNGLYIYDGATLTVKGEGTLIVNGHNGSNGSDAYPMNDEYDGGNGSNGESAINGNIIVEGGKVTVTGGRGGSGGYGEFSGGDGGDGGDGIKGNLTVNGGSVTVTGGSGGSGGTTSPVGDAGSNGSNAKAINGNISGATGLVAEESKDGSIWNYITGGSSEHQFVRAKVLEPVKVKLNAGTGHGALFTDEVLADMVSQTEGFASATREGDIITIGVTNTSMTEYELLRTLDEYIVTKLFAPPAGPRHNDEVFITTAPQSVDKYAKNSELSADIKARKENPTVIEEGFTAYMLWATKYSEEITLTAKTPVAGGNPEEYLPETPEGIVLYEITLPPDVPEGTQEPPKFNFWTTNTTEPFTANPMEGTFAAGDEYACVATPGIDPESSLWARYLADDISIKVDNATDEVVGKRQGRPSVSYKVTVAKVDVTGVTLNKDKLTLEKESNETLEATVAPEDASKKTVTWKSSNDDVATVDNNGKVTAVAVGTATITATATNGTDATDDDKTATCTVTVTGKSFNITKSEMENGSLTVKVGDAEATKAKEGETVTLAVEPAEGYQLKELQAVYLGMAILDLTEVTEGEEYTFTMPDNDVTVSAKFEKKPVTVKVDVGEGHAALFTSDVLAKIKADFSLEEVTISGNVITLKGVDPSEIQNDMQESIWSAIYNLTSAKDRIDNGEWFYNLGYRSFDDYATYDEFNEDIRADEHYSTPVSDGMTYYALWKKPYEKLEIDNGNPTCGMEARKAFPTTPNGMTLDPENYSWRDENGERVEKFEGGKEYTFNGQIYKKLNDDLWKYFIDEDNFTMTVKDAKDLEYSHSSSWIKFSFKATADHDWDEGTVTKEPTETAEGEKTFKCKHCGDTKTETIPKLAPKDKPAAPKIKTTAPKIKTTAKTSARAMTVKWTMKWGKVNGAKSYKVAYRKVGSKKWTYKTTKKTKYVVRGHKMKGLYEYKVAAVSKNGTTWSNTSRRYFSRVSDKAKAGKGSIKLSWKKDKTATGYQVFVATNKNMKNSKKFEVGKSAKSYKIKGLKKGKRYYVRVRPMKTHGGVTYKGILSKTIKVRVK